MTHDEWIKWRSEGLVSIGEDLFFPPPWDMYKYPEKTEGWIEFQKAMKKEPLYYGNK